MNGPSVGLWLGETDYGDQIRESILSHGYCEQTFETTASLADAVAAGAVDAAVLWADEAGCALARRWLDEDAELPLIAVSDGDVARIQRARALVGRLGHLTWPVLADELGDRLKNQIEVVRLRRENAALATRLSSAEQQLESVDCLRRQLERNQSSLATATDRLVTAEQLAAVGRVASGIAHEIASQLALVGYAEAIKSRVAGDPELCEFADILVSAQKRLAAMVEEIRDFATSHDREFDSRERQPAEVGTLVDEALALMSYDRDVRARDIVREYRDRALVSADRDQLVQVVINLVSNATLATPEGGRITIDLSRERGFARLEVSDAGVGMPAEVLARLGEIFFTTRGERGSGLGVGICKRIVEGHGGTLAFESAPGQGTRARVLLPLLDGDQGDGR